MQYLPYDAIIFDLDGTLTESEPGIVNSVQYAMAQVGVNGYAREDLRFFVGPPLLKSFTEAIGMTDQTAREAIRHYQTRYRDIGYLENSVYPGIAALLRSLKARGAHLGLATAKPIIPCRQVLGAFDLIQYFDVIAAPTDEDQHPVKADLIARALPATYRKACMVGDRGMDMEGAVGAGVDGIGALYGYGSRAELTGAGATKCVESVDALTRVLLGGAPVTRGRFITLEGSDGCGKSTQTDRLAGWLRDCGHEVLVTREPGGCPIAERIRGIVLDANEQGMTDECEALLFAAARAQHVREVILPALERGAIVLCDRFVDSSIAYQGGGRALGKALVKQINAPAVNGCMPDQTIFFDIDPELAMHRRVAAEAPDRIEREKSAFVHRVYNTFRELAQDEPERFTILDAQGSPEDVFERLKEAVSNAF